MDIIALAREIGKALQQDEKYLALQKARETSDNDTALQELIGEFNLKRMAINNEVQKDDRSEEKLKELNDSLRHTYAQIMMNENMTKYNEAKTEVDNLVQRVTTIISMAAEGEDPETCDVEAACSGNCATCGGCH